MHPTISSDDRRELLRSARAYELEAERSGRESFREFARELRRLAWRGVQEQHSDASADAA